MALPLVLHELADAEAVDAYDGYAARRPRDRIKLPQRAARGNGPDRRAAPSCLRHSTDRRIVQLRVIAQLREHDFYCALAEAELPQCGEDFGVRVDRARRRRVAVSGPIRVPEDEGAFVLALDE
jgi:hypothetical protein